MTELPPGLHGAYSRTRLHNHLGAKSLRNAIAEGRLVSYCRTVVIQRERMTSLHTRAAAALLMAGQGAALASHTAVWLHGCTAADTNRVHLVLGYERKLRPRPDVAVHYDSYDPADVVEIDGLRTMALDYALADLLCRARHRSTALACADQALGALPPQQRAAFKADLSVRIAARRDYRGRRQGVFLLDLATGLPESPPESTLLLMIAEAGFPLPEPQHSVRDLDDRELWRLDFAWPDARVAVEYDGYAAHVGKAEADQARDEDLRRRGWKVLRADVSDLRNPVHLFRQLSVELASPERRARAFRT
ncbi:hypothetical protein ADK67_24970 [Saccharothrix sp. NRRL B-16348]|uniref:DUF559 domain-containing protein n=1 Tax=Saccharothrix sp. NRRL B-16348 TaxID=1415542 RepID=UPI0006C6CB5C|nr:DUF559 domain-containing protein [Saccharothrix sp. NRRL B-16348]KOX21908.1 hypothetical protein ADK67_24970 [Saccharothrix sp. NRRL B-16348]